MYNLEQMALKPTARQVEEVCGRLLPEAVWSPLPSLPDRAAFPDVMRNVILDAVHQSKGAHELAIACAISAAFVAGLGTIAVERPKTNGAVLCTACMLACSESGERKSDIMGVFKQPLLKWEKNRLNSRKINPPA